LNNKAVINTQQKKHRSRLFICYGRQPELGYPKWRTGNWGLLGYFDIMVMWQQYHGCLNKYKDMLKDTGLIKSTKSVPMAGFYDHFLGNPDWLTAACISIGCRRLTHHQNQHQCKALSGQQLTTMI
jgi:hypothetical protein